MTTIKKKNFTKNDISKRISLKIGFPNSYISHVTDDIILILKNLIKEEKTKISNFGSFKKIYKNERIGRNPKNKKKYIIRARNSVSFTASKKFITKANKT